MLTKLQIEAFYKDFESLSLRFPVAALSKATGESKGNVSRYLSRQADPSEAFIKKFYDSFYEGAPPVVDSLTEKPIPYFVTRRNKKIGDDLDNQGIFFVPIAAQAGYARNYNDPVYLQELSMFTLPGFPYRGENYRVFEVKGDSMQPTYKEGYHLVCEKIEQDQWMQIANFYIYVIVLENDILVKRLYKRIQPTLLPLATMKSSTHNLPSLLPR
ncbi:S24 family peptidase [Paraflavitalea speifideaquila]|uniref:S24 family peptidase n=1 Tax=Paraflavitalea speifideaquila TaxID=3076558 RepID=UPI0028EA649A|nr:S24 family peptidase [Paraflavitalea speifideiaquila]